jgi:formylglycine-generating enzyme required for sulfatase activity
MGNDGSRADEAPQHRVTIAAFRAAPSPVTNAEYAAYIAAAGVAAPPFAHEAQFADPAQPVVGINWFDAVAYCEWLSAATGIPFRLPTEAEREFAALGGRDGGDWPWPGDHHPAADTIDAYAGPHAPLEACANGYGLRCMAENVHEWCSDWYDAHYYAASPEDAPTGPANPTRRRSARGGAWRHKEKVTRINARSSLDPTFRYSDFGFRLYAD